MARIDEIEQRLLRWAEWRKVGDGSGYPVKCVLHPDWSPPAQGLTPSMKVMPSSDARQTGRAVGLLSQKLQAAVVVHYIQGRRGADAAGQLGCKPDTVLARIESAHVELARMLSVQTVFATSG